MRERARLLRDGRVDAAWLDGIEETMAEAGAAVTEARLRRHRAAERRTRTRAARPAPFPARIFRWRTSFLLPTPSMPPNCARRLPRRAHATPKAATLPSVRIAPIFIVRHTVKRADARDCSTGEQKALLVSIVLANAWLQRESDNAPPLLLLDEIAAHLDAARRAALFDEVLALGSQAWMTGTDRALFAPLAGHAQFVTVAQGQIVHEAAP